MSDSESDPKFCNIDLELIAAEINAYKFQHPNTEVDYFLISDLLKQQYQQTITGTFTPNELQRFYLKHHYPDLDGMYAIQTVVECRATKGLMWFLVNWKGFPPSDPKDQDSWVQIDALSDKFLSAFFENDYLKVQFFKAYKQLSPVQKASVDKKLKNSEFSDLIIQLKKPQSVNLPKSKGKTSLQQEDSEFTDTVVITQNEDAKISLVLDAIKRGNILGAKPIGTQFFEFKIKGSRRQGLIRLTREDACKNSVLGGFIIDLLVDRFKQ